MFRLCQITKKVAFGNIDVVSTCRTFAVSSQCFNFKEMLSSKFPSLPTDTNYVKDKFNELVVWYEQVTGMDEVRLMQNRVIEAQDKFVVSQENRRDVGKKLAKIQSKLKEIHSELDTTSRGEERYLQLITEEHTILKDERILVTEFALLEREEREKFNLLSSCVKESHEKERAQADRTKYYSIILSVVGTIIGIVGSSIINWFKMREFRRLIRESTQLNAGVGTSELTELMKSVKVMASGNRDINDSATRELSKKLENVIFSLQASNIASLHGQVEEVKGMLRAVPRYNGRLIAIPQDMETMIKKQQVEMRLLVVAVTIMGVIIPIVVTLISRS